MVVVINSLIGGFGWSMIGCFNCPITGVRLRPTVRLHCPMTTVQNKTANTPIAYEGIVMVMMKQKIKKS